MEWTALFPLMFTVAFFAVPIWLFVRAYKTGTTYIAAPSNSTVGQPAGPWSRYFARAFDITVLSILFGLAINLVVTVPDFSEATKNKLLTSFIEGLIYTPPALLADAILMEMFGTTLGKKIFGISVRTSEGYKLTLSQAVGRNFSMWANGMALSFPLFSWMAGYLSFRKVLAGKRTHWDETAGYNVTQGTISNTRIALGIIVTIAIYAGVFVLMADL